MSLGAKEIGQMKHALGVAEHSGNASGIPYRNRYWSGTGSATDVIWRDLVKQGLAVVVEVSGRQTMYAVTDRGMSAICVAPLDGLEPSERYP